MEIYAYCFMPSHVHFVFRSSIDEPSELLRDFKRHTSKKMIETIENNPQESRKEWLLWMFKRAGKKNATTNNYQFWQQVSIILFIWDICDINSLVCHMFPNKVHVNIIVLCTTCWTSFTNRSVDCGLVVRTN